MHGVVEGKNNRTVPNRTRPHGGSLFVHGWKRHQPVVAKEIVDPGYHWRVKSESTLMNDLVV